MTNSMKKPLLSLAVIAFEQEQYIREAVLGAFSQTYSPLQIILSDDCSSDCTFEIMSDLANAYHGPHQVVLNRNPSNLGIGGHINRIMELAKGELVMEAAGDDISLPNRAEITWRTWEDSGRTVVAIQSATIDIDENGIELDEKIVRTQPGSQDDAWSQKPSIENYVKNLRPGVVGSAFSFSPSVYLTFGPLPEELIHEDTLIGLRALSLGGIAFIPIPLVKRRFHDTNIYSRRAELVTSLDAVIKQENRVKRNAENRKCLYAAFLDDMQKALNLGLIHKERWMDIEQECHRQLRLASLQSDFVDAPVWKKIGIAIASRSNGAESKVIQWMLPRLIPSGLFRRLKSTWNSARSVCKFKNIKPC